MTVSISKIKTFKACRRLYELKYVYNLEANETPEPLETGKNYHKMIEDYYHGIEPDETDYSKEHAMFEAYKKHIASQLHIVETEKYVECEIGYDDKLIGYVDGIADDGCLVEHKTSGGDIGEQYEYNLQWDEQTPAYMLMSGARKVHYTICKKPTIRQKQNETDEEFYRRMIEWYDDETETKIRMFDIVRTDEEISLFQSTLCSIVEEMKRCEENAVDSPAPICQAYSPFYRNTCHCNAWGRRCEYSPVCLEYDDEVGAIGFSKKE
jgi:hypothetical protein